MQPGLGVANGSYWVDQGCLTLNPNPYPTRFKMGHGSTQSNSPNPHRMRVNLFNPTQPVQAWTMPNLFQTTRLYLSLVSGKKKKKHTHTHKLSSFHFIINYSDSEYQNIQICRLTLTQPHLNRLCRSTLIWTFKCDQRACQILPPLTRVQLCVPKQLATQQCYFGWAKPLMQLHIKKRKKIIEIAKICTRKKK